MDRDLGRMNIFGQDRRRRCLTVWKKQRMPCRTEENGEIIACLSFRGMEARILPQIDAKDHSVRTDGVFGPHRVALMRGPLLYCLEAVDHPGIDLRDVVLPQDARVEASFRPDLLHGVVALSMEGQLVPPDAGWKGRLYRTAAPHPARESQPVDLLAVPYYAWANREAGRMQVWVREGC